MTRFNVLAAAAVVLVFVGCRKPQNPSSGSGGTGLPNEGLPRDLQPLPAAPRLNVAPLDLDTAGLSVTAARPQGAVQGEARPAVTFSRPVKALEAVEASAGTPVGKIEPALAGEWRWLGSSSVEFVPKGLVPMSTAFKVTVFKGLKALDGSALADDYVFSFETPRLELQKCVPAEHYAWVRPDETFELLFNQPVAAADLQAQASFRVEGQAAPLTLKVLKRTSIAEETRAAEAQRGAVHGERLSAAQKGVRNEQTRYTVQAEKPFPAGAHVTLVLPATLHGEQGPLTMTAKETTWTTYGRLAFTRAQPCASGEHCPDGPIYFYASNPVDLSQIKGRLKFTPPVEIDWDQSSSPLPSREWVIDERTMPSFVVSGKFRPGTRYRFSLEPGAEDVFHQKDTQGFSGELTTSHLTPSLDVGGFLALVEKSSGTRFPVQVVNLSELQTEQWNLTTPELARLLASPGYEDSQPARAPNFRGRVPLHYPQDQVRLHPFDLGDALAGAKTGTVFARLRAPELQPTNVQRTLVQVTDLAVHLKISPKRSLAWVSRLSTGGPAAGAKVTVYDKTGASLWTGTSDADGFADIPGTLDLALPDAKYAWEAPFVLVSAALDGDEASTADTWASGIEPYEFGISQGWEGRAPDSSGFVFTDRGIYRPGDEVFLKGVVRYRRGGELQSPKPGWALQLTVNDSKGRAVLKQRASVDGFGAFSTKFNLPADVPTGTFGIEGEGKTDTGPVALQGNFRVEEYRAPQFKVDVRTEHPALISGAPLEAQVDARYLFGGAMANAKVKWSTQREATSFSSPSAAGFSFDQSTFWEESSGDRQALFASGDGDVDAKGGLSIHAGQVETPAARPYQYTVEAEVTDVNRQTVAGRVSVTVHPAAYYVGLRAPSGFAQAKVPAHVDVLVVDTEGRQKAGRQVDVVVQRRVWKSVKKKTVTGFTTVSEPVDEQVAHCELRSEASAVPCNFTPPDSGLYLAKATVTDDAQRKHLSAVMLYAIGPGFVSWMRDDTDRIELVPDKTTYKVGDVAHILVKSPYTEANAVVTVEREGVLERRAMKLVGSVNTVDLKVTEAMVPNVFMGVLLVHPRVGKDGIEPGEDPGRPAARVGLVKLAVDLNVKRLAVAVKTPRADYRPGETVEVDVDVHNQRGGPELAQVTVFAVDDAILRLTSYVTPDPLTSIYPDRPLSVRLGEPLLNLVRHRGQGEKGEESGGGGGERGGSSGFRNNFKTTVIFRPEVVTDANGHAHVSFKLPDNLTTFRIMAVALSHKELYGSGASEVRVNKPLLALPALPRFARVGDHFEAGVVVHRMGAPLDVKVEASAEGAQLAGPATQTVNVSATAAREVRFAFVADRSGVATLRFAVSGGGERDGVETKLPVELPVELESVATYGDTKDRRVEGISPPKDARAGVGGLSVTMSSTALGSFQQGFQQLVEYPYGCLEQQSSRLVPFVALREIAGTFKVPWPGPEARKLKAETEENAWLNAFLFRTLDVHDVRDPDEVIRRTVRSIVDLQGGSGGFKYWPDSTYIDAWQSSYATLALYRAHEVGFEVPAETLSRAQRFLTHVAGGRCGPNDEHCPEETRVFAAYVLSRMHVPKPSFYGKFFEERSELPLFSQALLADMMFVGGGDRAQAKQLLQEILNHAKESPKGLHFEEVHSRTYAALFHSDTRTTGVVLQMLTDVAPDHPFVGKLAHYLTSIRGEDGAWRSTQEAAFSLMALAEVVRTKERETPNFKASVVLGGATLFEQVFKGRSMALQQKKLGMDALQKASGGKQQTLSFQKDGAGVLYYSALLQYAPTALPMTPVDRGMFVERWFEPYGGGGQSLKFYAGDLVRVRVRISTNQERHYAAFEVPLPAGLEAIDTSLSTSASQVTTPGEEAPGEGYQDESAEDRTDGEASEHPEAQEAAWSQSFYTPFNHIEHRDTQVVLFADDLPAGVHVSSFVARATTPGTFLLRPARGALMYEPEVFGRSAGGTFEVVLPPAVSVK